MAHPARRHNDHPADPRRATPCPAKTPLPSARIPLCVTPTSDTGARRMPKITYISTAGDEQTIDVSVGMTVMRAAIANNIPGIDADCGGSCACATCHVYVDPAWADRVKPPEPTEADMLDFVLDRQPTSRLSCQLEVTADLDGLIVRTPASQH
jgi:ferredoxin, 2Fe-2S